MFVDARVDLNAVQDQKDFHRRMADTLVAIDEGVIGHQGESQGSSLVDQRGMQVGARSRLSGTLEGQLKALTLDDSLGVGVTKVCRDGRPITYRFLSPTDDVDRITELLHRGYARLAAAGLRFVASHQNVDFTRSRLAKGETLVALDGSRLVGIVTLARTEATSGAPFYDRPDVASFGQFAVEPTHQGNGIGTTLLEYVEQLALLRGVKYLALDTSEQAAHLIRFYETRGYRFVEHVRWSGVNYRSVVMAKPIEHNTIDHPTRPGADATGVAESPR